jgi:hypothetical protein
MEQSVEFRVMSKRYSLHVASERPYFDPNGVGHIVPAKIISFEGGVYITSDEQVIEAIRKSNAYRQKKIIEITDADRGAFRPQPEQKTIRGPIGAAVLQKEAGVTPTQEPGLSMLSPSTTCDICGKEFKDDLGGKRVRLHKISHRRGKPQEVSVEEK